MFIGLIDQYCFCCDGSIGQYMWLGQCFVQKQMVDDGGEQYVGFVQC